MTFLINLFFICVVTFILKVLIAQSYNIIFMILKKPYVWIGIMVLIGVINMMISTLFNQGINIFTWSVLLVMFINGKNQMANKELKAITDETVDEIYLDLGIKNGRVLYKTGTWLFAISSGITYLVCYMLLR